MLENDNWYPPFFVIQAQKRNDGTHNSCLGNNENFPQNMQVLTWISPEQQKSEKCVSMRKYE